MEKQLPFVGCTNQKKREDDAKEPPPNYVAGVGRGAIGFITRSDIGPARGAAAVGSPPTTEEDYSDMGDDNELGLFASASNDDDDKEADSIWNYIDERMESRRKHRKEAKLKQEIEAYRESNLKISEEFSALKTKLYSLTTQEWDSIPEIGDYSLKKKKRKFESFVPVPDTLFDMARQEKHVFALDIDRTTDDNARDLTCIGQGRETILSLQLDRISDSVSGLTVVDPKGYLTQLNSIKVTADTEISDIKKARLLLKSVTQANPKHPPGWIAMARLEEIAGKIQSARQLIKKGCEECPKNEDVWLEASRLVSPDEAKAVIARGLKSIPTSVNLWLQASVLEHNNINNKRRVLLKALDTLPTCVRLWKAVIELCDEDEAKILLKRSVECCPLHVELWLALARLETYDNSKKVLNKARVVLPREPSIWIEAAKLEEAKGNSSSTVCRVIERGIKALQREGLMIDRNSWIEYANCAERGGFLETCRAIIRNTIEIGVEIKDRKQTWLSDSEECIQSGFIETARTIYDHALTLLPTKKSLWLKAVELEKIHGTEDTVVVLLRKAVSFIPKAEMFWLMWAKEKFQVGDFSAARQILEQANHYIPDSDEIFLAAFKIEYENYEFERARILLAKARERRGKERVWMKSCVLERELGNSIEERNLLNEGIKLFPHFFKLWLMLGQLEERQGHLEQAKRVYASGLKDCPTCIPLWLSLASLEEKMNGVSKARAVLTMARKRIPENPQLWLATIRMELRHKKKKEADSTLARALQECPCSGILWAQAIEMDPRAKRKSTSRDALKRTNQDSHVIAVVAKLFWDESKLDKARTWFDKAVTTAPEVGDFWALYYKFELQHGTMHNQEDVLKRCITMKPKYGDKWQAVSKNIENAHLPVSSILKKAVVD